MQVNARSEHTPRLSQEHLDATAQRAQPPRLEAFPPYPTLHTARVTTAPNSQAQPGPWNIWPDLAALAFVLALAWWKQWTAKDLVWSLWLSSLVVGYATILLSIFGPLLGAGDPDGNLRELKTRSVPARVAAGLFFVAFFFPWRSLRAGFPGRNGRIGPSAIDSNPPN